MQQKANEYAETEKAAQPEKYKDFKASTGWLSKVMLCHNLVGKSLHGEAAEMTNEERAAKMNIFLDELHHKIEQENITPDRLYNADQTGLFFQKLPNRIYCDKEVRRTSRGAKQMKSKERITLMVAVAADGSKFPLSIVGKAKQLQCFRLFDDPLRPPVAYTNQHNAWFDQTVTHWWLTRVFWKHHLSVHGDVPCILLLDNCSVQTRLNDGRQPKNLHIMYFPPT